MLIRCLPGSDRDELLEILRGLSSDLGAVRDAEHQGWTGPWYRLTAYLAWAAQAALLLEDLVGQPDLQKLTLTEGLRSMLPWAKALEERSMATALDNLLLHELNDQLNTFDRAIDGLATRIARWSGPHVFVVADTSFYLRHLDKLEVADLASVLDAGDAPIRLLFPMVVVDELDGQKFKGHDKDGRWRAGYTLAVLERVLPHPAETGVLRQAETSSAVDARARGEITLELLLDPLGHERLPIADDEIIDRVLAIKPLMSSEPVLITYDTGQATRAKAADLRVVQLPIPIGKEPETKQPNKVT